VPIIAFIMVLFVVLPCWGEEDSSLDELLYSGFKEVNYFGAIYVIFNSNNEEKIGLNKKELTDYLRLKFKNNFVNIPYKNMSAESLNSAKNKKEIGTIYLHIWTVGQDYPIAFLLELKAGCWGSAYRIFETRHLGFNSKEHIKDEIKKSITTFIEELAITFFKARGEM
jgi:hypothetical protein